MRIKYCPTEKMWSELLTKPLQGQQFRLMRAAVINYPVGYEEINCINKPKAGMMISQDEPETSSQECVEKDQKVPPMTTWSTDRQQIQKDTVSKIPMMWLTKKDTR